jgi:hypothetical protein
MFVTQHKQRHVKVDINCCCSFLLNLLHVGLNIRTNMEELLHYCGGGVFEMKFRQLLDAAANGLVLAIKEGWKLEAGWQWESCAIYMTKLESNVYGPGWCNIERVGLIEVTLDFTPLQLYTDKNCSPCIASSYMNCKCQICK